MSAKFMNVVFTDENPEMQKQIGCMTGIFQMFDRHHLLAGKRLAGQTHKRHPSGHAQSNSSDIGAERKGRIPQITLEKNQSKRSYENQRVSMESSRTSFSSSTCSSFSSLDCNKSTQQEPQSFDRAIFQEKSVKTPAKPKALENDTKPVSSNKLHNEQPNVPAQTDRHSTDFRDVVKDSIHRDTRGLSVKTSTKEVKQNVLKHRDSPRPGSYMIGSNGKSGTKTDLNESLRVLVKLKEAPWYFSKASEEPRSSYEAKDARFNQISRETHRFSYDGREISRTSVDSREQNKPASKLRDLPRLSLDSREGSLRSSNSDPKQNLMLKDFDKRNVTRASHSVVAKLMGLEAMPNLSFTAQEMMDLDKTNIRRDCDHIDAKEYHSYMSKPSNSNKSIKDTVTPRRNKPDTAMKPIANSRVPIETAPWRHPDRVHLHTKKATLGHTEAEPKKPPESVYGEIEKRLKELEFRQSNKDLRALKQILDAMHAKGLLESKKAEEQHSEETTDYQNLKSVNPRNRQVTHPVPISMKGSSSPRAFESPIVIMKPVKSANKSGFDSSVVSLEGLSGLQKLRTSDPMDKKKASTNNRAAKEQTNQTASADKKTMNRSEENSSQKTPRIQQNQPKPQQVPRENSGSSVKSLNSLSPRLQQRRLEVERKLRLPVTSSETNKPQKQSTSRQPSEAVSPRSKLRRKPARVQETDGQLSESSEARISGQQCDEVSLRSESNISLTSQVDVEVASADWSADMNLASCQQRNNNVLVPNQKNNSLSMNEDASSMEFAAAAPEQPSPISVLDPSFYRDELPYSPVKKRSSDPFKDDETQPSADCWSSKINHKKLESIEILVQKLRDLSSSDVGPPNSDHIASLCETQKPDHRYVSEILLASGILMKELNDGPMSPMPIHLHPSGHPINPDLFLVLEQTKSCWKPEMTNEIRSQLKFDKEKHHRKLIFDLVNEILIQKLDLTSEGTPANQLIRPRRITRRFPSGQRLLRELCSEIEELQAERPGSDGRMDDDDNSIPGGDLLRGLEGWTDFHKEIPGVVLEMERLIFKDLIDEVVSGEAASFTQPKSSRRRRQLFTK